MDKYQQFPIAARVKKYIPSFGIIAVRRKRFQNHVLPNGPINKIVDSSCLKCLEGLGEVPEKPEIDITDNDPGISVLVIHQQQTYGFIGIVKGVYSSCPQMLSNMVYELTCNEKQLLLTRQFDSLWNLVYPRDHDRHGREQLYMRAFQVFEKYQSAIQMLVNESQHHHPYTEASFPKGRCSNGETGVHCAIREFCEETGYNRKDVHLLSPTITLMEEFIGSDGKCYKNKYWLAHVDEQVAPQFDSTNFQQVYEVAQIGWYNYKQALTLFRDYDKSKKVLLDQAIRIINDGNLIASSLDLRMKDESKLWLLQQDWRQLPQSENLSTGTRQTSVKPKIKDHPEFETEEILCVQPKSDPTQK